MGKKQKILKVITAKTMVDMLRHHFIKMIVAAVAVTLIVFIVAQITFVPKYESVATLYIMKEEDQSTTADRINEYNMAIRVVNECGHLLKGHKVLDKVILELKNDTDEPIKTSYSALRSSINIVNPTDTRILEVKVTSDTPENAKKTVDALCEVGIEMLNQAMGEGQIKLYECGVLNNTPCNRMGLLNYLVIALVSAMAVYFFYIIAYIVDDRITSDEDIEEYFSLNVLGDIPNAEDHGNKPYGKNYKYAARGASSQRSNNAKEGDNRK